MIKCESISYDIRLMDEVYIFIIIFIINVFLNIFLFCIFFIVLLLPHLLGKVHVIGATLLFIYKEIDVAT